MDWRIPLVALFLLSLASNAKPTGTSITTTFMGRAARHEVQPVDLIIRNGAEDERLEAFFSTVGTNYETHGDVVQIEPFRACEPLVRDRTISGNVVVVFVDKVPPFLAGCVALDNQAKFAEKSGALALIVGSATRLPRNVKPKDRPASIPVVILDEVQTGKLRAALNKSRESGFVPRAAIQYVGVLEGTLGGASGPLGGGADSPALRLQVFRPTILNISLICLVVFLIVMMSVILIVKFRWHPTAHHDLWMRALAMAALQKMETRKFTKIPSSSSKKFLATHGGGGGGKKCSTGSCSGRSRLGSLLPRFASLQSLAQTTSCGQERCSICLEDFVEGANLRVLFCGHEFHASCVDPWLLSKRRCPLCQFDVVEKKWPDLEKAEKEQQRAERAAAASVMRMPSFEEDCDQLRPLLSIPIDAAAGATPSHVLYANFPHSSRSSRRSRSIPRRRPLRDRHELQLQLSTTIGPLSMISGYSSDVSSYPDGTVDL